MFDEEHQVQPHERVVSSSGVASTARARAAAATHPGSKPEQQDRYLMANNLRQLLVLAWGDDAVSLAVREAFRKVEAALLAAAQAAGLATAETALSPIGGAVCAGLLVVGGHPHRPTRSCWGTPSECLSLTYKKKTREKKPFF